MTDYFLGWIVLCVMYWMVGGLLLIIQGVAGLLDHKLSSFNTLGQVVMFCLVRMLFWPITAYTALKRPR